MYRFGGDVINNWTLPLQMILSHPQTWTILMRANHGHDHLVGGFNTSEKYWSIGMIILNIWENIFSIGMIILNILPPTSHTMTPHHRYNPREAIDGKHFPYFLGKPPAIVSKNDDCWLLVVCFLCKLWTQRAKIGRYINILITYETHNKPLWSKATPKKLWKLDAHISYISKIYHIYLQMLFRILDIS